MWPALWASATADARAPAAIARAEIGVVGGFVAQPVLEAEPLVEDGVIVVGPKSLGEGPISRRELEALTWITRGEGGSPDLG